MKSFFESFLARFSASKRIQAYISIVLLAILLVFLNILAQTFNGYLDLTEEKRFTLTEPTKQQLANLKDVVFVRVLLEGEFPAGFKRLQNATREMLEDYHSINAGVDFRFENPNANSAGLRPEERKNLLKQLSEMGITPMRLRVVDDEQKSEQYIFPFAIFSYKNREVVVKLLESDVPGQNPEITLNNSVALLEYKFSNAIQKLLSPKRPNILFTDGHGELKVEEIADLQTSLSAFYNTGMINLDSVVNIPFKNTENRADIVVVAKPRSEFSEKHKFILDQYLMQGGKLIWLIDRLNTEMQTMQQTGKMMPSDYPLNLEDLFFKYGFRIQPNMVLDMECARIPLKVGQSGGSPQMDMFKWYYHPIVAPSSKHPIVKSLDRVWLQFPSSIDTIKTKTALKKEVILASSASSRTQFAPTEVGFEILRYPPDVSKFNDGKKPMALLLEGQFPSLYENRVTQEQVSVLERLGTKFEPLSPPTKMVVVSDGDIAKNDYDFRQNTLLPLGFNRFENYKFGNKDFLLNTIEYMLDDKGIIEARGKEVKLRLLDTRTAKESINVIRFINLVIPLIFLGLFGLYFNWRRKKKYTS
jgi:ABC-2 type transport system permease protein